MLLSRTEFKEQVFKRDKYKCIVCADKAVDAHHILERKLFHDGGYYLDNGASLCSECHIKAETKFVYSPSFIRSRAGIYNIVLPPQFDPQEKYDK